MPTQVWDCTEGGSGPESYTEDGAMVRAGALCGGQGWGPEQFHVHREFGTVILDTLGGALYREGGKPVQRVW